MRKLFLSLMALMLVVAACGDDDAAADPASLDSCDGLAVVGIDLLQDTIDVIDGLDADGLAALANAEETPPEFVEFQRRGEELTARADEIGCSDQEMAALLADKAGGLSAESTFGQFVLEGVRSGEGGFFDQ